MSDAIKEEQCENAEKIVFKMKPRKQLRQRRISDNDDECQGDANQRDTAKAEIDRLNEIRERQALRQRPHGISAVGLALGKKLALEEEVTVKDPYNIKMGGLVNMHTIKSGKVTEPVDAYDVGIGTQFSAETNKRDEDEEMMKYIEGELQKRRGQADVSGEGDVDGDAEKYLTPEEAALMALPEHLRQSLSHRSEEMLSNQMLNGIPEVDLGIEAKIKNIEATEEAKLILLQNQKNKNDGPSQFVPTNMAVNFTRHNRFKIEDNSEPTRRRPTEGSGGDKQQHQQNPYQQRNSNQVVGINGVKRATDDYHYDKFKKQFRRY